MNDVMNFSCGNLFDKVYENLALPDSTFLGTKVTKKMILENNDLSSSDKKLINDVIQSVEWLNTLKPETLNILTYVTETVEYIEIAVLKVSLKADPTNQGKLKSIAKLFHTLIPYPVILLLELNGDVAISLADKRINQADSSKLVTEHFYNSQWFTVAGLEKNEKEFLKDFSLKSVSIANYYELYQGVISKLIQLKISYLSGEYSRDSQSESLVPDDKSNEEKTMILNKLANLKAELVGIRFKLKTETHMDQKMRLNVEAHKIKKLISELTSSL